MAGDPDRLQSRRTILLVDDDREHAQITVKALSMAEIDAEIQIVRDGLEALEYMEHFGHYKNLESASDPHLILLDLKMPKVSGFDVLRHLKLNPRTRAIPVAVLSGSADEQTRKRAFEMGAYVYIEKSGAFKTFASEIQRQLRPLFDSEVE